MWACVEISQFSCPLTATGAAGAFLKILSVAKLKTSVVSLIVVAGAAAILVIHHAFQVQQRRLEESMQQQASDLTRLRSEHDRLTGLIAPGVNSNPNNLNDLLRVRAEVEALRRQTNTLASLAVENRRLRERNLRLAKETGTPLEIGEDVKAEAIAKMNYTWGLMRALLKYAGAHSGQFPSHLAEARSYLPDDATGATNLAPDQFEIVYRGSLNTLTNPSEVMVLREKQAWPTPFGWTRAYGFADGHAETHGVGADQVTNLDAWARDGTNFDTWEERRMARPSTQ